jgi:hypothetical protein
VTLFTAFYLFFLALLEIMDPGYIARVWNLPVLSGVMLGTFPIEELLFGFGIGTYWSGVYEHITWHRST